MSRSSEVRAVDGTFINREATTDYLNAILFPPISENTELHSCLGDFKAVGSLCRSSYTGCFIF